MLFLLIQNTVIVWGEKMTLANTTSLMIVQTQDHLNLIPMALFLLAKINQIPIYDPKHYPTISHSSLSGDIIFLYVRHWDIKKQKIAIGCP